MAAAFLVSLAVWFAARGQRLAGNGAPALEILQPSAGGHATHQAAIAPEHAFHLFLLDFSSLPAPGQLVFGYL
jgi:hypothetical protein